MFNSSTHADEQAGGLFQQVGWGTLYQARPMHKNGNVVVYYDPALTDKPVVNRIQTALTRLDQIN